MVTQLTVHLPQMLVQTKDPRAQDREGNSESGTLFQAQLFNMAAQLLGMELWSHLDSK